MLLELKKALRVVRLLCFVPPAHASSMEQPLLCCLDNRLGTKNFVLTTKALMSLGTALLVIAAI